MRTIALSLSHAGLMLLLTTAWPTSLLGQYQDTGSQSARGFSNNRVQANISDQGSGYGPNGPYGPYYSRPSSPNQNSTRNWREQGQAGGLPNRGLALPSDLDIFDRLRRRPVQRAETDLGVTWSEGDNRLVAREVVANSELGHAGLQGGDELIHVDGQRVRSQHEWQRVVDAIPAGREVPIVVRRGDGEKTLRWAPRAEAPERLPDVPTESPAARQPAANQESRPIQFITAARFRRGPDGRAWFGANLDPQHADRAVLQSVERDGAADEAGLRPGDVILSLSGRDIPSSGALTRILSQSLPGSSVELFVERPRDFLPKPAPVAPDDGSRPWENNHEVPSKPAPIVPDDRIPAPEGEIVPLPEIKPGEG